MKIKFTKYKRRPDDKDYVTGPDGEPLYRLAIDGKQVGDGLTIDKVVEIINSRDELSLGDEHVKGGAACAT